MSLPVSMPSPTRRLLWGLAAIIVLGGALAWLAGSETALRIAASQAEAWSGGKLRLQGVRGSLYGPLQIERLSLTTEEKRFDILQARLDWKPRELLHRHLHISQLSLAELKITELKPSPEPPKRPESLALPVTLSLPRASLDRLVMAAGKSERVFTGMVLSLEKPARQYAFKLLELDSPWGKFQGRAELAEASPFAINGQASLAHPSGRAQLIAAGTLDRLRLKATAAMAGGKAEAEAVVNPFSSRPVIQALVTATGMDPSAWNPDLPRAGLDVDVTLASEGQDAFAGELALGNSRPGAWNRQLVPLKHLAARFSGNLQGVKLSDIQLDLGRAGRFTGNGQGDRNGLVLLLQTRDFDP